MKSVADHYDDVLDLARELPVEETDLARARGLTLAEEIRAKLSIPPFTNSAMDGFAVRAEDLAVGRPLPVRGEIVAGETQVPPLEPGTAARIMTGAPLPAGADAVLQVELTEHAEDKMLAELPDRVVPTRVVGMGTHIRRAGEDIRAGELAFTRGTSLTPVHISALAALGYASVPVHSRPRVGVLTTGAELRAPGEQPAIGQIPDSNGPLVTGLAQERGAIAVTRAVHTDDLDDFRREIATLVEETDLIVTTGGVSAGAYDVVKAVLAPLGVQFVKVAMQPGKPQGFGELQAGDRRRVPVICLPGNPVSVFVSMQLFGLPLIDALMGRPVSGFDGLFQEETVAQGWQRKPGRVQFMPCQRDGAGLVIPASSGGSGSHLIGSLPRATGLAQIPADLGHVDAGQTVQVMWFRSNDEF